MCREETRNTWLQRKPAQTCSSEATAPRQRRASAASAAVATAPADVPISTGNGIPRRGSISASARRTPT